MICAAGFAISALIIHYLRIPPALYIAAFVGPLIVIGCANALSILVPLVLISLGYRYGYVSYECSMVLAAVTFASIIAIVSLYR
jgi:hypothetical protein